MKIKITVYVNVLSQFKYSSLFYASCGVFDYNRFENMNILYKSFPTTKTSAAAFKASSKTFKSLFECLKLFHLGKI